MYIITPSFNKATELDSVYYNGFEFENSIDMGIPRGSIILNDSAGVLLSKFNCASVGTMLDMTFTKTSDEDYDEKFKFPTFYVNGVEDECNNVAKVGGPLIVHFSHPWDLFKDCSNHAYAAQQPDALIQTILGKSDRGIEFEIDNSNWTETEMDYLVKYKSNLTDFEFIQKRVLPFANNSERPVYLVSCIINDGTSYKNVFRLQTFKQMFESDPVLILMPNPQDIDDKDRVSQIQENAQSISSSTPVVFLNNLKIAVNSKNQQELFVRQFTSTFLETFAMPTGSVNLGSSLSTGVSDLCNKIPVDAYFQIKSGSSAEDEFFHRPSSSNINLMLNKARGLDSIFEIQTSYRFQGTIPNPGESVYMQVEDSTHWVNGKWVITDVRIQSDETSPKDLNVNLTLGRSSFISPEENTSSIELTNTLGTVKE